MYWINGFYFKLTYILSFQCPKTHVKNILENSD